MELEAIYESLDDVPETFRELYTERDGKFEFTGVKGLKTAADIDRVTTALNHERNDHKKTKERLSVWGDLNHEEVSASLARIPELEAQVEAGGGQIDENKVNEIVEGRVRTKTQPLERQVGELTKGIEERDAKIAAFEQRERTRTIHDAVREAMTASKVLPSAHEDVLLLAERVFEVTEDGAVLVKDEVGAVPGADPAQWLKDMVEKRPHWWPASNGGGAGGSGQGGAHSGPNPFTHEHWNMGEQAKILNTKGREVADRLAKQAGTTVGGRKPLPKSGS